MIGTSSAFVCSNTPTTESYTLSLHDALPISSHNCRKAARSRLEHMIAPRHSSGSYVSRSDRKSTRLNSSHRCISYAVFCLKKKKKPHGVVQGDHNHPAALRAQAVVQQRGVEQ